MPGGNSSQISWLRTLACHIEAIALLLVLPRASVTETHKSVDAYFDFRFPSKDSIYFAVE